MKRDRYWMAHPKVVDDLAIVRDAVLGFVVILVLIAACSTAF